MLNEKVNKYFRQEKFYKVAREYAPELKKIIIQFLRKKGVSKLKQSYGSQLDYDDLPSDPKEKASQFKRATSSTEVRNDFFSAKDGGYGSSIDIVPFEYKDFNFNIKIYTNKEFFIDGHDLLIEINSISGDYSSKKQYYYKINLMKPVSSVLDDIWDSMIKSIEKYSSGKGSEDLKKSSTQNRFIDPSPPEIRKLVKLYLQQWTKSKTLKSGKVKKTKYTDFERLPIQFSVSMSQSKSQSGLSSFRRGEPVFTINFKIKAPKFKTKHLEEFPKLREYHKAYSEAMKKLGYGYGSDNIERYFKDYKVIDSSHIDMFSKLEFVVRKMSKYGYIPTQVRLSWKASDPNKINFGFSKKIKEMAKNNPKEAEKKAMHKFGNNWGEFKEQFFDKTINSEDINFILRSYIKKVLKTKPRK